MKVAHQSSVRPCQSLTCFCVCVCVCTYGVPVYLPVSQSACQTGMTPRSWQQCGCLQSTQWPLARQCSDCSTLWSSTETLSTYWRQTRRHFITSFSSFPLSPLLRHHWWSFKQLNIYRFPSVRRDRLCSSRVSFQSSLKPKYQLSSLTSSQDWETIRVLCEVGFALEISFPTVPHWS